MKRIITQKDLADNPILKELGIKLGWAVSVTKDEVSLGKSNEDTSTTQDGGEGNEGGQQSGGGDSGSGGNGGAGNPGNKPPFTPQP